MNQIRRNTLRAATGALCLATIAAGALLSPARAQTTPTEAPAVPASPTVRARTISVKETFSVGGSSGKVSPFFLVNVQIAGPEHIRLDVNPPAGPREKTEKPSLYLFDGKNEYEYNGMRNYYTVTPAPGPGKRSMSQLRDMAAVAILLTGIPTTASEPGVTRTVAENTLDGRKLVLTTYTRPVRTAKTGETSVSATLVWTDPATGFPVRRQETVTAEGKTLVLMQTDFSDWKLDEPIADKQFAWAPPAGAELYTGPKVANVGKMAPDFTAYKPDGTPVKLSDLRGKIVILDFWATWCGPCQKSMPHLETVYKQVKDKDVVVLAVCVWDEKDAYNKWVVANKDTYTFPTVFDPAGRGKENIAASLYKVEGIPTQFIIDKDGKIAAGTVGYNEGARFVETTLAKLGVKVPEPAQTAAAAPAK